MFLLTKKLKITKLLKKAIIGPANQALIGPAGIIYTPDIASHFFTILAIRGGGRNFKFF